MTPAARRAALGLTALALTPLLVDRALAFCGFYVAQADAKLFNQSSQVVIARDGDTTTMTMANDYRGALNEFAVVIPVPVAVTREQVKVAEKAYIDHLDAYSAPRLVEYWDADPCPDPRQLREEDDDIAYMGPMSERASAAPASARDRALGVEILDSYTVGEYDILILSAKDSAGLETWLGENKYKIPQGAGAVLGSYIRQNMKFFVAKVNLGEQRRLEQPYLRPLQVRYSSPKFMLPIRLGMVNADGPQDLLVYTLTRKGRVETTNYRTSRIPTDRNVPESVKADFGPFYKALFANQVARQGMESVFLEYAWPLQMMCDPCSADPVPPSELAALGGSWVSDTYGSGSAAYLTRMHVRYDMAHFPEDLVFQETPDTSTFQGRYILQHPFTGDTSCPDGRKYEAALAARQEKEVGELVSLTGWSATEIRRKIPARAHPAKPPEPGFWDWR